MRTDLSRSDLNLMLDIIHESLSCCHHEAYTGLIEKTKTLLQFTHIRSVFGDRSEFAAKKMGALKMLTEFPKEWENRYGEKDYLLLDNIATTAFRQPGLIYWADFAELKDVDEAKNSASKKIMAEAASMGLKQGWLYSLQGRRSTQFAVISIGGEKTEKSERSQKILEYLSPHLCLAMQRVILNQNQTPARLTRREREILSWIAAGKTAWETSEILNISARTVEFHMGNIRNKLDAVNTQQAVAVALSAGLIHY